MTAHNLPRLAAEIFGCPLMVDPAKAAVMLRALGPRILGAPVALSGLGEAQMGVLPNRLENYLNRSQVAGYPVVDGIAVIEIEGVLVEKGAWIGMDCGETSYQGIRTQVERARRDMAVKAVVLEVDSFGGAVSMAFETAAAIRQLATEKPTLSILSSSAASAAYLLASQASRIVMPEFGFAGSIGACTLHADMSGSLAEQGITVTVLSSGAHKSDGTPFVPLPDEVAARITANLDAVRARFAEMVGAGRGSRLNAAAAMATEALCMMGPEALKAGLVDALADPFAAFEAFRREVSSS